MDSKTLDNICGQIYRRFPEVKGCRPKVSSMTSTQSLLIFTGKGQVPNGASISHTVRVVVSADGKILKTTTSR